MTEIYIRRKRRSSPAGIIALAVVLLLAAAIAGLIYWSRDSIAAALFRRDHDIVIVCAGGAAGELIPEAGAGAFARVAADARAYTPHVLAVDLGGSVMGSSASIVTSGDSSARAMRALSVDIAVPAASDIRLGADRLRALGEISGTRWISCGASGLDASVVMTMGDRKIAFVGARSLAADIAPAVSSCRAAGAEIVLLLLNIDSAIPPTPKEMAAASGGADAICDGSHRSGARMAYAKDASGRQIPIVMAGRGYSDIGRVAITPDGGLYAAVFAGYDASDEALSEALTEIDRAARASSAAVVARCTSDLSRSDENGVLLTSNSETGIGDLAADACLYASGAEIALVRGDLIREDIARGDVSYSDLMNVCGSASYTVASRSGAEVVALLEGAQSVGFVSIAGMTARIGADGKIEASVRGLSGALIPIDLTRSYKVASASSDSRGAPLAEALIRYAEGPLAGDLDRYIRPDGRLTIAR